MQSPYIEDHLWQGWAIFTALMVPTYLLARRIERRDRRGFERAGEGAADEPSDAAMTPSDHDLEASDPTPRLRPATALAVLGPVLFLTGSVLPRGAALDRDVTVFDIAPDWSLAPAGVADRWRPDFHGVDERVEWTATVEGETLHAARHYFVDQRQGDELIQYGNAIAPDSLLVERRFYGPVGTRRRLVNEAVVRTDHGFRVVWFWYRVGGFDTPFPSKAKLLEILAFFRRTPAAELVTLSVACEPESCEGAARTLRLAASGPGTD
jgi:hypothetical protein